ncbi:MAG: hypothetical protein JSS91_02155 [Bacteroidetes bacterium]|nr:hypothetical protein [Bacteroidota bacterium]
MDKKLKEILVSIDSRFSGPQSCRLNDMITGKIRLDLPEVIEYLNILKEHGGAFGNNNNAKDNKDAENFLSQIKEFLDAKNKRKNRR